MMAIKLSTSLRRPTEEIVAVTYTVANRGIVPTTGTPVQRVFLSLR